jgi:lipopolysaccharide export LptBFGC system permease protein LptF
VWGPGAHTLVGVLIGIAFFFLQNLVESGALVFNASPLVLAWFPTTLLALVATIFITRTR